MFAQSVSQTVIDCPVSGVGLISVPDPERTSAAHMALPIADTRPRCHENEMDAPNSKNELFENVRARWPEQFFILSDQSALPSILTEPSDWTVYKEIEKSVSEEGELLNLATWSFHQALNKLFRVSWEARSSVVRSNDVSFQLFDAQMLSNLSDSSWAIERAIYSRMPVSRSH